MSVCLERQFLSLSLSYFEYFILLKSNINLSVLFLVKQIYFYVKMIVFHFLNTFVLKL